MKKTSQNVINWRKRTKKKMIDAMGKKCQCCGYDKCHSALEFHHIDSTQKDFSFGSLRASPKGVATLIEELKKCILLCANCHREVHAGLRELPTEYHKLNEDMLKSEADLKKEVKSHNSSTAPIDRRKIFMSRESLMELLESQFNNNKSALARYLKVSETAIRKKLMKGDPSHLITNR